ncbi:MAG: transcriptional regulator [Ruminococcaceae bacterium]|nr:transcriptional regulator [Oscillospiraceae bacterium]
MKLITAIVNKEDSKHVSQELIKAGFNVTRLSTTGGFLMAGNVTMLIGTEDDRVNECIDIISEHSSQRTEMVPSTASYGVGVTTAFPLEVTVGGATIFVTNVERFEKV